MADPYNGDVHQKNAGPLETELQELRQLFSMSLDLICIADIHASTFLKVNTAFQNILGYSEKELINRPFSDFIHPDDIQSTQAIVEEKLRQGSKVINFENRYKCKDGSYKWLSWVSHPNLQLGQTYAIARDITEQKRVEMERDESEKKYRSLFYNAQVALFRTSIDGQIIEINKRYAEIAGYDNIEDCMAHYRLQTAWKNPEDRTKFLKKIQETGSVQDYEAQIVRKDGSDVWILFSATVYPDQGYIEGSIVNITDRKAAEQSLKESEARFKALHNASFGGITIHDKGIILECNQGLSDITGYSVNELIGMNGLLLIAEQSRAMVMDKILAGYEKPYEAVGLRKTGEAYPIRLEARNIPYKGRDVRTVEFRDITEQKKAEQEKEKLQGQLIQAQKMESVGRLAGGVAHDFNNMLSIILGNIEMVQEDIDQDSPLLPRINEVKKAAQRSADLTRQLLAFARKQTISPKVLNPNLTIEGMLKMLERLIGEDIDLLWRPKQDVWPVKLDPSQIDQILANLCVNARDAIKDVGKVTIETDNISFDERYCRVHKGFCPGDFVLIGVSDNGCGMDKETMAKLFDPFFTTKKSGDGTGLGLATIYGIIKQNNGFINVYSEPGLGTTFKLYIPKHSGPESQASVTPKKPSPKGDETILLVEDEAAILKMTTTMLERLGYIVLPANSPEEAIALAHASTRQVDLLITDVVMPSMNGRELARTILNRFPDIKCLYMSGYTSNVIAHRGILDEGLNFINKPFSKQELSVKLRDILDE